jgi:Ca2+-binding EF-hand superfamily protein
MGEDWDQMHIYRLDVDCESGVHCFADLNHDRVVDMAHLIELVAHWGEQSSEVSYDLTHDGVVDINDLLAMLGAWGECEE